MACDCNHRTNHSARTNLVRHRGVACARERGQRFGGPTSSLTAADSKITSGGLRAMGRLLGLPLPYTFARLLVIRDEFAVDRADDVADLDAGARGDLVGLEIGHLRPNAVPGQVGRNVYRQRARGGRR